MCQHDYKQQEVCVGEMTTKTRLVNVCVQMTHTDEASVCAGDGWTRGVCCGNHFRFTLPYGLVSSLKWLGPMAGVPLVMGGRCVPWSTDSLFLLVLSREDFQITLVSNSSVGGHGDLCLFFVGSRSQIPFNLSKSGRSRLRHLSVMCYPCVQGLLFRSFQDAVDLVGRVGGLVPSRWVYLCINLKALWYQAILTADIQESSVMFYFEELLSQLRVPPQDLCHHSSPPLV